MTRSYTAGKNSLQHKCTVVGCKRSFRTAALLRGHTEVHNANLPHICKHIACNRRFSRVSHLRQHTLTHQNKTDGLDHLDHPSITLEQTEEERQQTQSNDNANNEDAQNVLQDVEIEEAEVESEVDADEVVENAIYFMSQLRVARSAKITNWNSTDVSNAHQWAVWVQDTLHEVSSYKLKNTLRSKGLPIELLRMAERAFFDSVLAYTRLNSNLMRYVVTAALASGESSLSCLQMAITGAVERRREVNILRNIAGIVEDVSETEKIAHGRAVLQRHQRTGIGSVMRQIQAAKNAPVEVVEVLCYEAKAAERESADDLKDALLSFVREEVKRSEVATGVSDVALADLCEIDVHIFDTYLKKLLERFAEGKVRKEEKAGKIAKKKYTSADELRKRIYGLTQRVGPVGYFSREIVSLFCRRTGTQGMSFTFVDGR